MKCLICDKEFIAKSRNHKVDKRRVTCSRDCARTYRRVRQHLYNKIKKEMKKEKEKDVCECCGREYE